jgi:phosphonate transport system permease protein
MSARPASSGSSAVPDVARLWRERPKSRLLQASSVLLILLVAYSWSSGDLALGELFRARRFENLARFLSTELVPFALRGRPFDLAEWLAWARATLSDPDRRPIAATGTTLAISVLAISLAGLLGIAIAPFAARNLATREPFEPPAEGRASDRGRGWRILTATVRGFSVFLRAIPEYVWAFLLLAMLGASAWPAVLALAIHNAGILGKLGGETVENLDHRPLLALRLAGASRAQIAEAAVWPLSASRYLLYFFYRFETCVREATVLGMLGVASLGYWIQDARSKHFYDELVLFVGLGALIVLAGDLLSALARALLRRAA